MTKRVLIDSDVFIEYMKGNPKALETLSSLLSEDYELFINAIVYSEVVFLFVSRTTGLSALSLKKKPQVVRDSGVDKVVAFLSQFKVAEINDVVLETASEIIKRHGLLPNDAIILATAKVYGMVLATLDSDFEIPAKSENVEIYSPKHQSCP
jgi:predicted nucleic acid-binding protein